MENMPEIFVLGHKSPDIDSLAAAAALALHARGLDEAGDALLENAKGVML